MTASGNLETHVKGGFGVQSHWPQLCHLVSKFGVRLQWERIEENNIHQAGNAQIIIGTLGPKIVITGKVIRKEILEKRLSEDLQDLKNLPMQGTFIDINNADYLLSQNIHGNFKITDNLIRFWYKARHKVLPSHYTLPLWYPEHSPECRLDGSLLGQYVAYPKWL